MPSTAKRRASTLLNDYHLLSFDSLDSTNEEAKRLAKAGGCHGAVIWAKEQTSGKGRMGREWVSQEGNLFVSILLAPDKAAELLPQLSFVTAVAAIEALEGMLTTHNLTCKWPNDILLDDRKLGGILLESFQAGPENKNFIVVGVGINVETAPEGTEFPATCLKAAGVELVSAKIILSRFVHHFIEVYNVWDNKGFTAIRKCWEKNAWGVGTRLCARLPDSEIEGISEGIDTRGGLILRLDNGKKHTVQVGDVFPAQPMDA